MLNSTRVPSDIFLSKKDFRKALQSYFKKNLKIVGNDCDYESEMKRHRFTQYFENLLFITHKFAKDYIISQNLEEFEVRQIKKQFDDLLIHDYLNRMVQEINQYNIQKRLQFGHLNQIEVDEKSDQDLFKINFENRVNFQTYLFGKYFDGMIGLFREGDVIQDYSNFDQYVPII
ncbi:UNKNOWN [Stylonychia lemnae]|uniref:Uncharacterized protein n=1 Tax=Stylonychia lemnae TaxID=5949 RepID=A0A078BEM5_STYLE|nr:UNKNOWN [Stylonychia lemnae]|eukprot:CDW91607.1 UNKNOWN [Stylonychia lemnae]